MGWMANNILYMLLQTGVQWWRAQYKVASVSINAEVETALMVADLANGGTTTSMPHTHRLRRLLTNGDRRMSCRQAPDEWRPVE